MSKYRKKPVEVEAELYKSGMEDGYACYLLDGKFVGYYDKNGALPKCSRIPAIKTLEGFHEISDGDWIITGIKGERYPIKPDIFELTYESADTKNQILIREWTYTCGDRCCTDWGTDLIINGERITDQFDLDIETLEKILKVLNVEYEIEQDYEKE